MPLTIIKADGAVLTTPPMPIQQEATPEMARILQSEVTNPIEVPEEAQANPLTNPIEITNPIEPHVVYSDVPGAGPEDEPEPEEEDEDEEYEEYEEYEEEEDEPVKPKAAGKALNGPPNTKAVSKASTK